jgi:hypothetical protein
MKWNRKHIKGTKQYMGFNPSGITSEEIKNREILFVEEQKKESLVDRQKYWETIKEMTKDSHFSWDWEWCAFERNFVHNNTVV